MNKTVSANIGGLVFNIEEKAYEKLAAYLEAIRTYLSSSEGSEEILQDIEARIAELFQERITIGKQVVTMSDVDEIISIMGQPEAYITDDISEDEPHSTSGV